MLPRSLSQRHIHLHLLGNHKGLKTPNQSRWRHTTDQGLKGLWTLTIPAEQPSPPTSVFVIPHIACVTEKCVGWPGGRPRRSKWEHLGLRYKPVLEHSGSSAEQPSSSQPSRQWALWSVISPRMCVMWRQPEWQLWRKAGTASLVQTKYLLFISLLRGHPLMTCFYKHRQTHLLLPGLP